jgi:hypothetical protein
MSFPWKTKYQINGPHLQSTHFMNRQTETYKDTFILQTKQTETTGKSWDKTKWWIQLNMEQCKNLNRWKWRPDLHAKQDDHDRKIKMTIPCLKNWGFWWWRWEQWPSCLWDCTVLQVVTNISEGHVTSTPRHCVPKRLKLACKYLNYYNTVVANCALEDSRYNPNALSRHKKSTYCSLCNFPIYLKSFSSSTHGP